MCMHNRGGGETKKGERKKASTEEGERERSRDKEKLEYYTNVYQFSEAGELTNMLCPVHTWNL